EHFKANPALVKGYIGPGVLGAERASKIRYLIDPRIAVGSAWVTGADEPGRHVIGLVNGRDFTADGIIQAAEIKDGDECPGCGHSLLTARGIEMGHIFQLGRKYADALDLKVLDVNGKLVTVTMGSYGVGVSRAVAAIAENSHDEHGLIWPREISPADVHLVIAGKTPDIAAAAEDLAQALDTAGVRVLLDDRNASVGVKFTDAELLGVPTIVVVGRGIATGVVELRDRATGDKLEVPLAEIAGQLVHLVRTGHLRVDQV
ncbi:MAG: His/Gly/Thr/Pro-type tRNA ligase C-terminal domain-containing protein, partial [Nakamurella sp.]